MSNELSAFSAPSFTPALTTKPAQDLDKGYAPNLQLVASGTSKVFTDELAKLGEFIIKDGDSITRLGKTITVVLLGKIFKAVDRSGEQVVVDYDQTSDVYKDIVARQAKGGYKSKCMHGPVYLAYVVEAEQFGELSLLSNSAKREESNLDGFVPLSPEQAEELGVDPRGPVMTTLESRKVEKGDNTWYVFDTKPGPKALAEGTEPPSNEVVLKAVENFYKQTQPAEKEEESRDR